MTDRQGIEIDYCPKCRGVWLDRGELDKLIERAAAVNSSPVQPMNNPAFGAPGPNPMNNPAYGVPGPNPGFMPPPQRRYDDDDDDFDDDDRNRYRNQPGYQPGPYGQPVPYRKKREGFLGNIFDFD